MLKGVTGITSISNCQTKLSINSLGKVQSPSDETGQRQAELELAVLQAPFKETGVATPEKIKTFFYSFSWCNDFLLYFHCPVGIKSLSKVY